jgi:hypothetical protein
LRFGLSLTPPFTEPVERCDKESNHVNAGIGVLPVSYEQNDGDIDCTSGDK